MLNYVLSPALMETSTEQLFTDIAAQTIPKTEQVIVKVPNPNMIMENKLYVTTAATAIMPSEADRIHSIANGVRLQALIVDTGTNKLRCTLPAAKIEGFEKKHRLLMLQSGDLYMFPAPEGSLGALCPGSTPKTIKPELTPVTTPSTARR